MFGLSEADKKARNAANQRRFRARRRSRAAGYESDTQGVEAELEDGALVFWLPHISPEGDFTLK